jgi:pimeloyl-ACP methyl ester carboxylesterase
MIARRHNFQRIYDLRERILPDWNDAQVPPIEQTRRTLALQAVRFLGITSARWVADYFRTSQRDTAPLLPALASEGALIEATVEGWQTPAYIHPDNLALAEEARAGTLIPELTTLLSPFDPLVWDRARALAMFGFDYRIECYTPAPKRRYGYFTLPILRRGQLIGRLDPKAHRQEGRLEIKALHLEPGIPVTSELVADIAGTLREFADWHATPTVDVRLSDPPKLAAQVQRAVDRAAAPPKRARKRVVSAEERGHGRIRMNTARKPFIRVCRRLSASNIKHCKLKGRHRQAAIPERRVAMNEAFERGAIDEAVEYSLHVWTDGERRTPDQVNQAVREQTRAITKRLFSRRPVEGAEQQDYAPDALERLAELRAPTLAIVGSEDNQMLHDIADRIASQSPNARRVVIPDAGHHPNMEHPEVFNEIVHSFLSRL